MQREFQVGDRVRLTKHQIGASIKVGQTGTVVNVGGGYPPILVEFDEWFTGGHDGNSIGTTCRDGHGWWLDSKDLELIEPAKSHRFKVGDRVRITDDSVADGFASQSYPLKGQTGVIRHSLDCDGEHYIRLDDTLDWGWIKPEGLELIEAADKPERETYSREDAYAEIFRQVMSIQTPPMFGQWITTEPKPSSANGIMGRVKTLARRLLDKDTQSLVEAGVLNDDLSIRSVEFVLGWVIAQNKKELAIEARAKIKAERDEDED